MSGLGPCHSTSGASRRRNASPSRAASALYAALITCASPSGKEPPRSLDSSLHVRRQQRELQRRPDPPPIAALAHAAEQVTGQRSGGLLAEVDAPQRPGVDPVRQRRAALERARHVE